MFSLWNNNCGQQRGFRSLKNSADPSAHPRSLASPLFPNSDGEISIRLCTSYPQSTPPTPAGSVVTKLRLKGTAAVIGAGCSAWAQASIQPRPFRYRTAPLLHDVLWMIQKHFFFAQLMASFLFLSGSCPPIKKPNLPSTHTVESLQEFPKCSESCGA